jgi:WD40 repeat protein
MSSVRSVGFSPDGRFALSGSWDQTLRLWGVASGQCLQTFKGHTMSVSSVWLSPDGRFALSGSKGEETVRPLETTTGRRLKFGCRIALPGSWDQTLRLWEVATGHSLRTFEGHTEFVTCVCFSPDGRFALSGDDDAALRLWELATGRCLRTLTGHTNSVRSVCFSPDGRFALSGSEDHTLRLWELDWELEAPEPTLWDEGARPYLDTFLTCHTPYAGGLSEEHEPTDEEVRLALTRKGKPVWTDNDFDNLLQTLGCVGYGWLSPEGVREVLEEMTRVWQGPTPLPGASGLEMHQKGRAQC